MKKRVLKPRKARRLSSNTTTSSSELRGGWGGLRLGLGRHPNTPLPPPPHPPPPPPPTSRFNKTQAAPGSNTRRSFSRHERWFLPPPRGGPSRRIAVLLPAPLSCPLSHFHRSPPTPPLPFPVCHSPDPTHPTIHDIAQALTQVPARPNANPLASLPQLKPGAPGPRPCPCHGPRVGPSPRQGPRPRPRLGTAVAPAAPSRVPTTTTHAHR